jgi:Secretion system C-terminal sorting domain
MPFTTVNKLKLLLLFTFLGVKGVNAQTFQWAKRFAAKTNFSAGYCNTVDASGNVYSVGEFFGTVDFDPNAGVANLTDTPGGRYYVSKLTSAGNYVWAKNFGAGSITPKAYCITTDPAGNVYIAGVFNGNVDFDPGAGTFILNGPPPYPANFLLKLNSAGNFLWAVSYSSAGMVSSIFTDASNNVYVVGSFNAVMDFDPGAGVYNITPAGYDVFITRLTSAGAFAWAKKIGGAANDRAAGGSIDAAGNLYVSGFFAGTADFDPGTAVSNLTAASTAGYDAFVTKLNAAGNFTWARRMGGTASTTMSSNVDIDGSGNVYLSGHFSGGTADFDPGAGVSNLTSTGTGSIYDIFICKLTSAGNFVWARRIGGANAEWCSGMNVSAIGHVFLGGDFDGTVDFDPGAGTQNRTSAGNSDMFIMMLNTSGNYGWVWTMGSAGDDNLAYLTVDGSNNIYSTGAFTNTVDFNGGSGTFNLTASINRNAFVHKLSNPSPLPIELLSFNATQNKNAVDITWQTSTETNNDYFTIEKSKDANEFIEVEKIDGAGNSSTILEYSYTDKNPYTGISYYRLKQTDFNGEFTYSKTVAVYINANANNPFIIYQNPTTAQIIVAFKNPETQPSQLVIHDVTGRIVFKQQLTSATTILNTTFLPGIYVASVNNTQQTFTQKVTIK